MINIILLSIVMAAQINIVITPNDKWLIFKPTYDASKIYKYYLCGIHSGKCCICLFNQSKNKSS